MRYRHLSWFLLAFVLVLVPQRPTSPETTKPPERHAFCNPESLPEYVRNRLDGEFTSWKVQEPDDLSLRAHERWDSEKPLQCPSIVIGQFENDKTIIFGVLLVPRDRPDAGYKFLVFSPKSGMPSYEMSVLDESSSDGASNLFIRKVEIDKFFDTPSKRKFHVQSTEGILSVASGENEYGVDIYFWVGNKFEHQPIDY